MTKHKELLLGGKKVGETSFLSKHCEDGVFEWGWQDGKLMSDGMKKYTVKPKPILGDIYKKRHIMRKGKSLAEA